MLVYTKVTKDEFNESVSLPTTKLGNKKTQNVESERQKSDGNGGSRPTEKKSGGQRNIVVEGMQIKRLSLKNDARRSPRLISVDQGTCIRFQEMPKVPSPIKFLDVRVVLSDCSNIVNNRFSLNGRFLVSSRFFFRRY